MKQIRMFLLDYTMKELTYYDENGRRYAIPRIRDVHYHHYTGGKSKKECERILKEMGAKNITIKEKRVKVVEQNV